MSENKIKCPRCKKAVTTQPLTVKSYYDPSFECKTPRCLFRGKLKWEDGKSYGKEI